MKKINRILCALLCIVLMAASVPFSYAEESDGVSVVSFSAAAKRKIVEKLEGRYQTGTDSDGNTVGYYYYYYGSCIEYTAVLSNGETLVGDDTDLALYFNYSDWVRLSDTQGPSSPWGLGKHDVTAEFMGKTATVQVEVVKNPVESISARQVSRFVEGIDGYIEHDYSSPDGKNYLKYNLYGAFTYTVTYDGGKVAEGPAEDICEIIGMGTSNQTFDDGQSADTPWGVGMHEVTVGFMGHTCKVNVSVVRNPIEKVTATATRKLIENVDGYEETEWINDESVQYFKYNPRSVLVYTVTYDGGKVFKGTELEISRFFGYETAFPEVETNENYNSRWGLGVHEITVKYFGKTFTAEVEVAKNTVKSISAKAVRPLYAGLDTVSEKEWLSDGTESEYQKFNLSPDIFEYTVTAENGEVFKGDYEALTEKFRTYVDITSEQSADVQWDAGKHTAEVYFMGITGTAEVEVSETAYTALSIDENDGFTITLTDSDGNVTKHTPESFSASMISSDSRGGSLKTDIGTLNAVFYHKFIKRSPAYDRDVSLQIGTLKSNTLERCLWFKAAMCSIALQTMPFTSDFTWRGAVTRKNIDTLVNCAFYADEAFESVDTIAVYIGDTMYYKVSLEDAKRIIGKNFDVTKFDFTKSKYYNEEDGTFLLMKRVHGGESCESTVVYNKARKSYTVSVVNYDKTYNAKVTWNNDGIITAISRTHVHTPRKFDAVLSGCEKDGSCEFYRCTSCGKLFSDEACTHDISWEDTVVLGGHSFNSDGTCTVCGINCLLVPVGSAGIFETDSVIYDRAHSVSELTALVKSVGGSKLSGTKSYNGVFGSGATITAESANGEIKKIYTVALSGDLNGDGVCDVLDAMLCEKMLSGHMTAKVYQKYAANGGSADDIDISSYQRTVNEALK